MDAPGRLSSRRKALAGALFFLCAFALYAATHVASLYLDDSGETITVGALLGVGHPPGYPLHTLIAHLASLLPLGGPAETINLLGAVFGAACGACVFVVLLDLGAAPADGPPSAPFAALAAAALPASLLCLGPVFWHNALGAKGSIYQLNNLLSVLMLGLLGAPGPLTARRTRAFWLLLGLAFAHHYMSQLPLLPAYAWLLWKGGRRPWRDAWLAAGGLGLYLYIPLRSALQPALDWGGVRGLSEFWFFFFRLQYAASEVTRSFAGSAAQAAYALKLTFREGAGVLSVAALAGLWLDRRKAFAQALALASLASLASVTLYLNLKPERLPLMQPYLFPGYLCQALLAGGAFLKCAQAASKPLRAGLLAVSVAAIAALGAGELPALDLSDYYFALDGAHGLLVALPRKALLLCEGDAVIFPLWYLQRVLGERRDVATVGLAVLPMDWVRQDLARNWPDLGQPVVTRPIGAESVPSLTRAILDLNGRRPLYASFNTLDPGVEGWTLVSEGPDFRCVPASALPASSEASRDAAFLRLQAVPLRGFTRRPADADTLKYLIGDMGVRYNALGVDAENAKDYVQALGFYEAAARVAPEDPVFPFNTGNALYDLGRRNDAVRAFSRSAAVDPGYTDAWYNLGVAQFQLGRALDAQKSLLRAHALDPSREDVVQVLKASGGL